MELKLELCTERGLVNESWCCFSSGEMCADWVCREIIKRVKSQAMIGDITDSSEEIAVLERILREVHNTIKVRKSLE